MDLHVLLVTTDFVELSVCRRTLLACGCRVTTATTFERAAALLPRSPDVVIAAAQLREFTGLELGAMAAAARPAPAVAILGGPDEAVERDAHAHGFEFLLRPILPGDLTAFVEWRQRTIGPAAPAAADAVRDCDMQNAGR